jgi:hypothetical protein
VSCACFVPVLTSTLGRGAGSGADAGRTAIYRVRDYKLV